MLGESKLLSCLFKLPAYGMFTCHQNNIHDFLIGRLSSNDAFHCKIHAKKRVNLTLKTLRNSKQNTSILLFAMLVPLWHIIFLKPNQKQHQTI